MDKLMDIRGLPVAVVPWFKRKHIEETMDYRPLDGDIVISSYPKTGTNWLHYIVIQILSKGEFFPSFDDLMHKDGPLMEMVGLEAIEVLKEPRNYKNHYPFNLVKKNEKAKYLYIYRNPGDIITSYYHFLEEIFQESLDFDDYFDRFIDGNICYGSFFDHLLSHYAHESDSNLLLVSYEKLYVNRNEEILRIAKFLGEEYAQELLKDESLLEKIIENTSFEYMKKKLTFSHPGSENPKPVNFFRKGVVGDGKNVLTEEQRARLQNKVLEKMKGTRFISEWDKN